MYFHLSLFSLSCQEPATFGIITSMKGLFLFLLLWLQGFSAIKLGVDVLLEERLDEKHFAHKKVGLISNQSAINCGLCTTYELLKRHSSLYEITAVFAPEHGFFGAAYAYEPLSDQSIDEIPLYGLEGKRRRPTEEMLDKIDILVFDVQDIGSRSYTFASTLFYCMEEAAKKNIPVFVLDRPNPMGGVVVDGPLLDDNYRSFLGYINVPYCHGMTIGELALFFNEEYKIGCHLTVIPMRGWKREMTFAETGLSWVPTSPQIPEEDTPFFYPTTGLLGHLSLTNIGIGYTLPFKLVGSPWIEADKFAIALNQHQLPGVFFQPFYFRPFFGKFKLENCQGVKILITDPKLYLPVTTQFVILGVLKQLYPKHFSESIRHLSESRNKKDVFHKLNGNEAVLRILAEDKYVIWKLREMCLQAKEKFIPIRKKYLLYK